MKTKILIADDDIELADLLAATLRGDGYEVCIALQSEEFRELVFQFKPDLIILDIHYGDENGPDVYRRLLAEGLDRNIPVVFLSALISLSTPQAFPVTPGRKYAMRGKPFHYSELMHDIKCLLSAGQTSFGQSA